MKIKVFALATDGDAHGTSCGIYTDEKAMYLQLAEEKLDDDEQAEAKRLADAGDLEAFKEYVDECESPWLFTYSIDEKEIEIPDAPTTAIVKELMQDVEAFGVKETARDWPDLLITYNKARKVLKELVRCVRGGDKTAGVRMDDALLDADAVLEEPAPAIVLASDGSFFSGRKHFPKK